MPNENIGSSADIMGTNVLFNGYDLDAIGVSELNCLYDRNLDAIGVSSGGQCTPRTA
jgi:hypothetical protein